MQAIQNESLIPLTDAARLMPCRRGGRPTHVSTLFRWTTRGLRGIRLEYVQVGGTKCTSREALGRFFERLAAGGGSEPQAGGDQPHG